MSDKPEIHHTRDTHYTVVPTMAHPPTSPDAEFGDFHVRTVEVGPGNRPLRVVEDVVKRLPLTRKEILEADAEEAIERERAQHVPRHMKRHVEVTHTPSPVSLSEIIAQQARAEVVRLEQQQVVLVQSAIEQYLDEMNATIWGRHFDLIVNREAAVNFLLNAFIDVSEIVDRRVREAGKATA